MLKQAGMRGLGCLMFILAGCGGARADDLCPDVDKQPTTEGKRMPEDSFDVLAGIDAADALQTYLNQDTVSYDFAQVINSAVVKGVILRQQALATRAAVDLAKAKAAKPEDVAKAEADAKRALDAFCAFMVNAVVSE